MSPQPLGILAGRGVYPKLLMDEIQKSGVQVVVAGLAGQIDAERFHGAASVEIFPIGAIARAAAFFKRHRVVTIYFAGGVRRTGAWQYTRLDRIGLGLVVSALARGDDTLLRRTADAFEKLGVQVGDPAPYLDGLLAPEGHLAGPAPTPPLLSDLSIAWRAAQNLGKQDKGQGAVARAGRVLALEGRAGTDQLIERTDARGGVVVKVVKPGQDRRFDLPAVGPETIYACKRKGLLALGVEAGGVLLLEKKQVQRICDTEGITLLGLLGCDDP